MAKTTTLESPNCLIGEGSVFEGRFYVNGSIMIEGKFQGDIRTDDQLVVGQSGKVKTDIVAKKVTIAGTLIGNITASEEVCLLQSGRVLGNITTPKLTVEPGVVTQGQVTIVADVKNDPKKAIEESFGPEASAVFNTVKEKGKGADADR